MDNDYSQEPPKITNLEIEEDNCPLNNIEEETMPPNSPWHFILTSYIPIWKFDEQSVLRINLTREKLSPYYFCHILLILIYIYYYNVLYKYVFPNNPKYQHILFNTITFTFIMTHVSYLVTHFTNPGILPFNWSTTKQRFYTKNELRDGFAINHDQKRWGKMHDWPSRSFFSGDFGAIVLRADHYCWWINHWVGLRNHKFFIQSVFYCTSFAIQYVFILYKVFKNPEADQISHKFYFYILFIICLAFCIHHIMNFLGAVYRALNNVTTVERLMRLDTKYYHQGFIKNLEEIFGSVYLFPLWFFPIMIPLPVDGFNYKVRTDDICFAKNRSQAYVTMKT